MSKPKVYLKSDFLRDVATEARNLKKNARKKELGKLDFDDLNWNSPSNCIYGQISEGNCRSPRAKKLIQSCCKRYFHNKRSRIDQDGIQAIKRIVNGKEVEDLGKFFDIPYLSSIEAYICMPKAKNENLINYLQGKTNKLIL
jgi:hypothetical protein